MENLAREPGRLITPLRSAESILEGAVRSGQRLRLVDRDGYVLAEAHGGAAPSGEQLPPPARRLFRWIGWSSRLSGRSFCRWRRSWC